MGEEKRATPVFFLSHREREGPIRASEWEGEGFRRLL
jgi:hypothetical protein